MLNIIDNNKKIDIGPVIEGNRMVKNKVIKLEKDEEWVNKISGFNKINYYLLSLPIMVLNKYFIFKAKND